MEHQQPQDGFHDVISDSETESGEVSAGRSALNDRDRNFRDHIEQIYGIPARGFILMTLDPDFKVQFKVSSNAPSRGRMTTVPIGLQRHMALGLRRAFGYSPKNEYRIPLDDNGVVDESYYQGHFTAETRPGHKQKRAETGGGTRGRSRCPGFWDVVQPPTTEIAVEFDRALKRGTKVSMQLQESWKISAFVARCLENLSQLGVKWVLKQWIKTLNCKKQSNFPYMDWRPDQPYYCRDGGRPPRVPGWFPADLIRHREPDHISREERTLAVLYILRLRDPDLCENRDRCSSETWTSILRKSTESVDWERASSEKARKEYKEQNRRILNDIYEIAALEEDYMSGEKSGSYDISRKLIVPKARSTKKSTKKSAKKSTKKSTKKHPLADQDDEVPSKKLCVEPETTGVSESSQAQQVDRRQYERSLSTYDQTVEEPILRQREAESGPFEIARLPEATSGAFSNTANEPDIPLNETRSICTAGFEPLDCQVHPPQAWMNPSAIPVSHQSQPRDHLGCMQMWQEMQRNTALWNTPALTFGPPSISAGNCPSMPESAMCQICNPYHDTALFVPPQPTMTTSTRQSGNPSVYPGVPTPYTFTQHWEQPLETEGYRHF